MKKSLTLLAGASMLMLGVPSVTFAQAANNGGSFNDVPADHWAYQSVLDLQKQGIVIGYPDGTYGGKRAMTRYEFAVAIARLLPMLKVDTSNLATKDDLSALRTDLQSKIDANSAAIADLQKLVNEFQPELEALGQDVASIKERLNNLEGRVAAVEIEQRRVRFTGAENVIFRGDNVSTGANFVDQNGVTTGKSKHILQTSDVYQDFVLGITGRLTDTATAHVSLDFGNYLSALGNTEGRGYGPGDLGYTGGGIAPGQLTPANQQTTVWEAYLDAPVGLGPLGGAELIAGRFGNQFTKYTLKQVDSDVYTNLYQTNSGNIITDGAKLNLKVGPANVAAWAGKFADIPFAQPYGGSSYGNIGQRPTGLITNNHANALTQGAGLRATFGKPESAVLGLTLEEFGLDTPNGVLATDPNRSNLGVPGAFSRKYNRLGVYGADFNGALPFFKKTGLTLDAAYNISSHGIGNSLNNVGNTYRYAQNEEQLGFVLGALSVKGGYQYVGPEYSAPGYWGRVGAWSNPTNVKGGIGSAKYAFSPKLSLNADVESYKAAYGTTKDGLAVNSPLQAGDKLNRYQVGLGYGLTSAYAVDLGYEHVEYDLKNASGNLIAAGKPTETYLTLGLGHDFNQNTSFKLLYQFVKYDDKGTGFDPAAAGGKREGGVAVGQFSLKF